MISDERAERRNLVNETLEALVTMRPGVCGKAGQAIFAILYDKNYSMVFCSHVVVVVVAVAVAVAVAVGGGGGGGQNCGTTPRTSD